MLALILLKVSFLSFANWTQTGPETGFISIKENNGILYSTNAIGLYKSIDNGLNWNRVSIFAGFTMNDIVFTTNKLIASTNKGIFYSADGGVNWVSSNQGMTNTDTTGIGSFFIYKTSNGRLITSVNSGTYFSDNNGVNWTASNYSQPIVKITETSSTLISSDGIGIIISIDNGLTWQSITSNGIIAADYSQLTSWYFVNNKVYAGGIGILGLYESSDNGQNWILRNSGLSGSGTSRLEYFNGKFYKKVFPTAMYEFDSTSNTWVTSSITQSNDISIMGFYNGRYFGVNQILFDGIVYSDNYGINWQNTSGIKCMILRKLSSSENLYALNDTGGHLYDSTQSTFNRTTLFNKNYSTTTIANYAVYDIKKRNNGTIYLATAGGVWKSTNNGISYTQSFNGLPFSTNPDAFNTYTVYDMFISGSFPNDTLFVGTTNGIYFSTDDAQTFTQITSTNGNKMQQFLKYQNVLYCAGTKIFKRNNPNNWTQFTSFTNTGIMGFAATDGYLFVTVPNSPLKYASISGTTNFTNITTGNPDFAYSVAAYDTLVFFMGNGGVYKLNTSILGAANATDIVQIAANLPFYSAPNNLKLYSYLKNGFGMAIFNGKLWLGTFGMSTFYRSLNDFGYSITVGEKAPNNEKIKSSGVVFPNPTKDKITFTDFTEACQLSIFNTSGQLILNANYNASPTVDISKLYNGFYTYSIIDQNQIKIKTGKFLKE
jgi:hypothetical protein